MVTDADIIDLILQHEGGTFTDHPNDHGGPTKWGITIPVLSLFRGTPVTEADIRDLERDEAARCYATLYVAPFALITAQPLRSNAIDLGVNAGVERSIKILQQTIGVSVDGVIGPATSVAANMRDWNPVFTGVRVAFYENIIARDPSQLVWRNGWRRRALSFLFPEIRRSTLRTFSGSDLPLYGHMGKAA